MGHGGVGGGSPQSSVGSPKKDGAGVFCGPLHDLHSKEEAIATCSSWLQMYSLHSSSRERAGRKKAVGEGQCRVVPNSFWKGTLVLKESRSDCLISPADLLLWHMTMEVRIDWNYMLRGTFFPTQADRLSGSVAGLRDLLWWGIFRTWKE